MLVWAAWSGCPARLPRRDRRHPWRIQALTPLAGLSPAVGGSWSDSFYPTPHLGASGEGPHLLLSPVPTVGLALVSRCHLFGLLLTHFVEPLALPTRS